MKLQRILILLLANLAVMLPGFAAENWSVKPLPTMDKLPSKLVRNLFHDNEGFLWFSSDNILCRDDGFHVAKFYSDAARRIRHITQDSVGRIVISTNKGVWLLDKKDSHQISVDPKGIYFRNVEATYVTSEGDLWLALKGELRRYSKDLKLKKIYPISDRGGRPTYVSGFCEARDGSIYMTSFSRGVYKYDKRKDQFTMYRPIDHDVPLGKIIEDRKNNYFWIYDHRGGIYRFSPDSPTPYVRSQARAYWEPEMAFSRLIDMAQDEKYGYIWGLGSSKVMVFKPESDGTLTPLNHPVTDRFAGAVMSSLLPWGNNMFISGEDRETVVVNLEGNQAMPFNLESLRTKYNLPPIISDLKPNTQNGIIWMLQERSGLMLYDMKSEKIAYHDDFPKLEHLRLRVGSIIATSQFHKGGVWVAQRRSQAIFAIIHDDMTMQMVDSVVIDHVLEPSVSISRVMEDSQGRVWMGTTSGIYSYDLHRRSLYCTLNNVGSISGITETADRRIFALSSDSGLYEISGNKARKIRFEGVDLVNGSALAADPDNHIWIGTTEGSVYEYNPRTDKMTEHTKSELGFESEIKQILFGKDGHGWIFSDSKLIEFNPQTNLFYTYLSEKDIPLFRFMTATMMGDMGEVCLLGGVGGVSLISPTVQLNNEQTDITPIISDIWANGETRLLTPTAKSNLKNNRLTIESNDRNVEIYFAAMNCQEPGKVRFKYKMEGVDKDWQVTDFGDSKVAYTNLPSRTCTLLVKAIDEYGRESTKESRFQIKRKPYWYESWWAILIYIALICMAFGMLLYSYLRRTKQKNNEIWQDSKEMMKMKNYLESTVELPDEEFRKLDRILVEKATKCVEDNLDDPDFGVNNLAEAVNMSRSTFTRKIKAVTGQTPLDFIRKIRMMHACHLLESKNYTVSQVAEMVGFSDRRYFTTSFGKEMGVTPKEYINGLRRADKERGSNGEKTENQEGEK